MKGGVSPGTQVYFQNKNGLGFQTQTQKYYFMIKHTHSHKKLFFCVSRVTHKTREVRASFNYRKIQYALRY